MPERLKNFLLTYTIPLIIGAMAVGAARRELEQKEDGSQHALDIQRVEAKAVNDVQRLQERDEALFALQLDILCAVKPHDRRCYPK
jgi:hypothetical protein